MSHKPQTHPQKTFTYAHIETQIVAFTLKKMLWSDCFDTKDKPNDRRLLCVYHLLGETNSVLSLSCVIALKRRIDRIFFHFSPQQIDLLPFRCIRLMIWTGCMCGGRIDILKRGTSINHVAFVRRRGNQSNVENVIFKNILTQELNFPWQCVRAHTCNVKGKSHPQNRKYEEHSTSQPQWRLRTWTCNGVKSQMKTIL